MSHTKFILTLGLFVCILFNSCVNDVKPKEQTTVKAKNHIQKERSFTKISKDLLSAIKNKKASDEEQMLLANADSAKLQSELDTDAKKMAFWVNIYNAYIQIVLTKNPDLYKNRNDFFKKEQVKIAGHNLSFDKIEHGLIRSSTWKLSKGYLPKIFPGDFEKNFRLDKKDGRIHFVLNCGAKDCPPVYIFDPLSIDRDFDHVASLYLKDKTTYNQSEKTVKTTPLFQWFTGDFGVGKKGVKDMLAKYNIIPEDHKDIDVQYIDYDWTLDLGNFGATLN